MGIENLVTKTLWPPKLWPNLCGDQNPMVIESCDKICVVIEKVATKNVATRTMWQLKFWWPKDVFVARGFKMTKTTLVLVIHKQPKMAFDLRWPYVDGAPSHVGI